MPKAQNVASESGTLFRLQRREIGHLGATPLKIGIVSVQCGPLR